MIDYVEPPTPAETADASEQADLMRRAADLVARRSEKATKRICPEWTYHAVRHIARNCDIECYHGGVEPVASIWADGREYDDAGITHGGWDRYDDSPWISLVDPRIAAPLVELLRHGAEEALEIGPDFRLTHLARELLKGDVGD